MQTQIDSRELRSAFSRFATGVTVVTYEFDGEPRGMTVNSFTSVSLDPPLVLVSIARSTATSSRLVGFDFAINVLSEQQQGHALQFSGRPQDSLEIKWRYGPGAPELDEVVAVYQCTAGQVYAAGDHDLHVAEVISVRVVPDLQPLLFVNGQFARSSQDLASR